MTVPTPTVVDILADVADEYAEHGGAVLPGAPEIIRSLAQYAGNGGSVRIGYDAERKAMVRLASYAVARIEKIDNLKGNS